MQTWRQRWRFWRHRLPDVVVSLLAVLVISTSGDSPRGTSAGRELAEIGVETSEEFKTLLVRRQKRLSQSAQATAAYRSAPDC